MYYQMQVSISIILILMLIIYIFLKNNYLYIRKEISEFILVIPFIFSIFMWLSLFISSNLDINYNNVFFKPDIISSNKNLEITAKPDKLILNQNNKINKEIKLKEILFSDSKFIEVESNNALILDYNGYIKIKPLDKNIIVLNFKKSAYYSAFKVTLISWSIVLISIILSCLLIYSNKNNYISS